MNKRAIVSILSMLLAIVVLSGAVSAADIGEAQINVENDVDESVIVCSDIIMVDEGTFSDLADEIGEGGNITLEKNVYTYNTGDTIKIRTPGVIDGNGALIDMTNSNIKVFDIIANGVIIKNLNFINVNSNTFGGAMDFWHSGVVQNCNFINCSAYQGSAICIKDTGLVENCNFINNTAYAATVYLYKGTIRNCNFTGNTAFEGSAAAINFGTIENCNFNKNTAERNGGAAWLQEGNVKNCNFNNNYAGQDGGAVFMYDGSVDACTFNNNQAYNNGGAVYANNEASVTNSIFKQNEAFFGGAVYMQTGSVENSIFNGDKAIKGDAIFIDGDYAVKNCGLSNIDSESAIESNSEGIIENCSFDSVGYWIIHK